MKGTHLYIVLALTAAMAFVSSSASAQKFQGGYATMRVFDCNKAVGMGSGFITAKILIAYENGTTEEVNLLPYNEKNEMENLKKITETLNKLKAKGYFLISQTVSGDQGALVSDYTLLKQGP